MKNTLKKMENKKKKLRNYCFGVITFKMEDMSKGWILKHKHVHNL